MNASILIAMTAPKPARMIVTISIAIVTSLVVCYEMVLAIFMSVPENVWDECYRTCSRYLHKCYWGY